MNGRLSSGGASAPSGGPLRAWPALSIAEAHDQLTAPGAPFETGEVDIRGVRMKVWKTGPATIVDLLAAGRAHRDRTFLVHGDERVSFDAHDRAVAAFARELQRNGLERGDRVAIIARNMPEWVVAFYGALLAGAIATPLSGWWTADELFYGLNDSGARFLVADHAALDRLRPQLGALPNLRHIYLARGAAPDAISLDTVLGPPARWTDLPEFPAPDLGIEPDDDATILYTSGTSGRPKGVLTTHRAMLSNIVGAACAGARVLLRRGESFPPAPAQNAPQGVALLGVPLFHATGSFSWLNPSLYTGRRVILMNRWDAGEGLALIERERVTMLGGVPTIVWQLIDHPDRAAHDLTSVVTASYGGMAAPPELVQRIREAFPNARASHGWGMTETSSLATTHAAEDFEHRPTSCGPAVPVGEISIRGENGKAELPCGEVGELWYRGPQVARGYWNDPAGSKAAFRDGWVRSGDIARVDEEGFLFIVDRLKDMIIRGGENIHCIEVENVLRAHPSISEAALVGRQHPTLGEVPVAVIATSGETPFDEAALRAFVGNHLAAFKVPVAILRHDGPLPRNPNGKIVKSDLRALVSEEHAAATSAEKKGQA
jgi:long-chain acyl-CoA synthetase